jgi:hypothetical protein
MPVLVSAESGELQSILDWQHGQRQPTPDQYLRGIAFLELLWQQTIPGLSFKVVHDEADQLAGSAISYRPWLRDEFTFRCVYCLLRKQWGRVTGEFDVEHFRPLANSPELG